MLDHAQVPEELPGEIGRENMTVKYGRRERRRG
jgi:hypothetical protein